MTFIIVLFWASLLIIIYVFIGYGILLLGMVWLRRKLYPALRKPFLSTFLPELSLVIPCYNEANILPEKIKNSLQLDYPAQLMKIYFITDGSNDNFREVLSKFPQIHLLHEDRRGGKTAAENRAMKIIHTPIVIFSDANTMLNRGAVKHIVRHFEDKKVGCVSGEKRILTDEKDNASSAGEGIYWKYESFLKKLDSDLYSAVGAAGELVAFRSSLYEELPEDTILDDFMQSMLIASKGFRIVYEPDAYAMEKGSLSIKEELKRKIRISAGGWQSIKRLWGKITPGNGLILYFQYISHRVLRWTVTPFLLIILFISNLFLWPQHEVYRLLMIAQILFYSAALLGYFMEKRKIRFKILFVPFYFCMMNYAVIAGLVRFLKGSQKGVWEKVLRKD